MSNKKFKYIWWSNPIDFYENAMIPSQEETERVLSQMPEPFRGEFVCKCIVPYDSCFAVLYTCKADNNGTTYIFSDYDVFGFYKNSVTKF